MTAFAIQQEQSNLLSELETLLAKCQCVDFRSILAKAISQVKVSIPIAHKPARLSDEELASLLTGTPTADINKYTEPTDEEWHIIAQQNRGRLTKGLEKWL